MNYFIETINCHIIKLAPSKLLVYHPSVTEVQLDTTKKRHWHEQRR